MKQKIMNNSLEEEMVPLSIIPTITFYDQVNIVHHSLKSILHDKNSHKKEIFFRILRNLKTKQFSEVFNESLKKNETSYWKSDKICFIHLNTELSTIFLKLDSPIIKILYNELFSKDCDYFCVFNDNSGLIFSLSSSHFLIWSLILKNLEYLFLASILLEDSLLTKLNQFLRWETLEETKINLKKFFTNSSKKLTTFNYPQNLTNDSKSYLFMISILNLQKKFIANLAQRIKEFNKKNMFQELEKIFSNVLNSEIKYNDYLINDNFIDSKPKIDDSSTTLEFIFTESFKRKEALLLKITPLTFLEAYPQIEPEKIFQESGSYYTPISLAETLVYHSFKSFFETKQSTDLFDLRIFDPAMGTGIILLFAIECLVNFYLKVHINTKIMHSYNDLRLNFLERCIYGNDLDKKASRFFFTFCEIFYINGRRVCNTNSNFRNFNFLEKIILESDNLFSGVKFDIILSNPPYLALHSRFSKYPISKEKTLLIKKMIPKFSGKRDNFYLYFLGLCLTYLAKKEVGVIGFVIDASFLDLPSYSDVRKYLLDKYQVCYILSDFNYKSAVVDLSLVIVKNTPSISQNIIWQKSLYNNLIKIKKDHFIDNPNFTFSFQQYSHFLTRLKNECIPLGKICKISCGLEYGSLLKTHFLSDTISQGYYPVLDGAKGIPIKYLLFWTPGWPNSYVRFDKEYENWLAETKKNVSPNNKKVILISGDIERFLSPKIILRQTATKFIAMFDDQNYFLLRNLHVIYKPKKPYSIFLLLGIINSSLASWIGEKLNIIRKKGKNRYPQIRLNDLKSFPIIDLTYLNDKQIKSKELIEALVKKILISSNEVSSTITKLWISISKTESKNFFKSQKHFLKACIDDDININLPVLKIEEAFNEDIKTIRSNINKLNKLRILIDKEVFTLYNITKDEEELIELNN